MDSRHHLDAKCPHTAERWPWSEARQRGDRPDPSLEKEIRAHSLLSGRCPGTGSSLIQETEGRMHTRSLPRAGADRRQALCQFGWMDTISADGQTAAGGHESITR